MSVSQSPRPSGASSGPWIVVNAVAAPLIRPWLFGLIRGMRRAPRPAGPAVAHAPGTNPDRVLILGNGPALGFGVLTWDLSLAGHLARRLATLTGRGADVEVVSRLRMTAAVALGTARGIRLSRYDAVVVTIGMNEAMTLTSPRQWRAGLTALLDHIDSDSASEFHTFVVGNAPAHAGAGVPRIFAAIIESHIARLNAVTAEVVAPRHRATFVTAAPNLAVNLNLYSSASYDEWAQAIAPTMTAALCRASGSPRPSAPIDETARQAALEALGVLFAPADETIDSITALARNLFGVSGAAVTFLDTGRVWTTSTSGFPPSGVQRTMSFCETTVSQSEVFVVEDALLDARFRAHPAVAGSERLRFYAGYPLRSPDGERVGAFGIFDRHPRQLANTEASLLRELALQVQRRLWARATETPTG